MRNIVDERGFNQIYKPSQAKAVRLQRRANAIVEAMSLPRSSAAGNNARILEIGCGMGDLAYHLALHTGVTATGVDLSPKFIEHARSAYQLPRLDFQVMDVISMPPTAPDQRYNFIVGNGILHHLYRGLDHVLPRLREWLLPGGRLIFWEPNLHNPYVYLIFSFAHLRRMARLEPDEMAFTRKFIEGKLLKAGYAGIDVSRRDFLLPNTPRLLIPLSVWAGNHLDRWAWTSIIAQSLFIVAENPGKAVS